ncbi:MAG: hypothetical protein OEO77_13870, partial [Acidimicrobiia bacterium]|nr:hypothetical protein [Acidimicrobiia bacterium]
MPAVGLPVGLLAGHCPNLSGAEGHAAEGRSATQEPGRRKGVLGRILPAVPAVGLPVGLLAGRLPE